MPSSLYEVLEEHPELFAMLADPDCGNTAIVDAVNNQLGPGYTTTEASVRRARMRFESERVDPEQMTETVRPVNFSDEDRREFHRLLDLKLDQANASPETLREMDLRVWEGFLRNNEGEPEKVTLRKIGLKTQARPLDWVSTVPSLEELALIRDYRPVPLRSGPTDGTLVVALGDLQVGKINLDSREVGTEDLWRRVRATTREVVRHIQRSLAFPERIILLHAGDCVEGYTSQGGRLIKLQDLYLTQQVETYQRILEFQVLELAPLCERLDVAVVPGNHDETTREFEVPDSDSWALFAARNAARFLEQGGIRDVYWHAPEAGKLAVEFNIGPVGAPFYLTMVHGHKIASNAGQLMNWWRRATFGNQPGARSRILITGHFHHYRSENAGDGKTWIQVPAMDGGSSWYANKAGDDTPAGMITFWLEPTKAYPIQNLMVHSEEYM